MAGNCRSKKKKKERNLRLLAGDDSLPRSRSGWSHPILPAVIHSFPTKSNYTLYSYLPYLALLLFKVPFTHMFGIF